MAVTTAERIYEGVVKPLPRREQLELVERIVHSLAVETTDDTEADGYDWMAIRGIAPGLMRGEDAQAWVSRTRRESDEQRERQWRGVP